MGNSYNLLETASYIINMTGEAWGSGFAWQGPGWGEHARGKQVRGPARVKQSKRGAEGLGSCAVRLEL